MENLGQENCVVGQFFSLFSGLKAEMVWQKDQDKDGYSSHGRKQYTDTHIHKYIHTHSERERYQDTGSISR